MRERRERREEGSCVNGIRPKINGKQSSRSRSAVEDVVGGMGGGRALGAKVIRRTADEIVERF